MHFESALVPSWLNWAAGLLTLLVLALALLRAPWRLLLGVNERQHLLFGAVAVLVLIWSLPVTVAHVVAFHLLLINSVVLMFGLSFGLLAALFALLIRTLLGGHDWAGIGVDAFCTVLVPALVPLLAVRISRRIPVAPVFAFTLGAGFVGGAFSAVAATLAALFVLALSGQQILLAAALKQVGLLPLLMFSEGFINGTFMTALAVFHPEWVRLFDEPE